MTTDARLSDLIKFLVDYPKVAARPEIIAALDGIFSLQEAEEHIQKLFWQHHQDLELLGIYGEFLYLSGYDIHLRHPVNSPMIHVVNETTRTVKRLALEQWQTFYPGAYPGYIWLHYPSSHEKEIWGRQQVWQVSVYHRFENALTHDISLRLGIYSGTWDLSRSFWYRKQVPYGIDHSTSKIAEYPDGRLKVVENITYDWNKVDKIDFQMRHCSVHPHAPAFITEQMHPGSQEKMER